MAEEGSSHECTARFEKPAAEGSCVLGGALKSKFKFLVAKMILRVPSFLRTKKTPKTPSLLPLPRRQESIPAACSLCKKSESILGEENNVGSQCGLICGVCCCDFCEAMSGRSLSTSMVVFQMDSISRSGPFHQRWLMASPDATLICYPTGQLPS